MIVASLALGVVAFVLLLRMTRAPQIGADALAVVRRTVAAMTDRGLSDDEKERLARRASLRLLRCFLQISLSGLVAAAAPAAIIWTGVEAGLFAFRDVETDAMSPPVLIAMAIGSVATWIALERLT